MIVEIDKTACCMRKIYVYEGFDGLINSLLASLGLNIWFIHLQLFVLLVECVKLDDDRPSTNCAGKK